MNRLALCILVGLGTALLGAPIARLPGTCPSRNGSKRRKQSSARAIAPDRAKSTFEVASRAPRSKKVSSTGTGPRPWSATGTRPSLRRCWRAETERMARGTRAPERLAQLFAAMNNDGFSYGVPGQCGARRPLDSHSSPRTARFTLRPGARRKRCGPKSCKGRIDPPSARPPRARGRAGAASGEHQEETSATTPRDWTGWSSTRRSSRAGQQPTGARSVTPVLLEEHEAFAIRVPLGEEHATLSVASYAVPKRSWDSWWSAATRGPRAERVPSTADPTAPMPALDDAALGGAP